MRDKTLSQFQAKSITNKILSLATIGALAYGAVSAISQIHQTVTAKTKVQIYQIKNIDLSATKNQLIQLHQKDLKPIQISAIPISNFVNKSKRMKTPLYELSEMVIAEILNQPSDEDTQPGRLISSVQKDEYSGLTVNVDNQILEDLSVDDRFSLSSLIITDVPPTSSIKVVDVQQFLDNQDKPVKNEDLKLSSHVVEVKSDNLLFASSDDVGVDYSNLVQKAKAPKAVEKKKAVSIAITTSHQTSDIEKVSVERSVYNDENQKDGLTLLSELREKSLVTQNTKNDKDAYEGVAQIETTSPTVSLNTQDNQTSDKVDLAHSENTGFPSLSVLATQFGHSSKQPKLAGRSPADWTLVDRKENTLPKNVQSTNDTNTSRNEAVEENKSSVESKTDSNISVQGFASMPQDNRSLFYGGSITEAFTSGKKGLENVEVQVLGTPWRTKTDSSGIFSFTDIQLEGVLPVILTKPGYLSRRVDLVQGHTLGVELVSENSVSLSAMAVGQRASLGAAYIFGQVDANGENPEGFQIEIEGPGLNQIYYLDENGIPDANRQVTSSKGQFIILNMIKGTYLIVTRDKNGVQRAPHLVYLSDNEGLVRRFGVGQKMLISGFLTNASTNSDIGDANVEFLGSEVKSVTDRKGQFNIGPVYVDCSELNYIQFEKKGFYRNRFELNCSTTNGKRYFAFSAGAIDAIGSDSGEGLKATTGIIVGNIKNKTSVKMQLWEPEEIEVKSNQQTIGKDFYYGQDGVLDPELNRSISSGNYAIVDITDGLFYLQKFTEDNNTIMYKPVLIAPSTVNVVTE